jgi:hypothetical protein
VPPAARRRLIPSARGGPGWLNPCPELEHAPEIVGVAPDLVHLSTHDPKDEGRGELLAAALAGDAGKALLEATIPRTHGHFVGFSDHVLD